MLSAASASKACSTADSELAWSPEISAGRNTTCAPAIRATSAMRSWSVDTTTRSTSPEARQASTARAMRARPATGSRFFNGTPFEPPRAGMTAAVRMIA